MLNKYTDLSIKYLLYQKKRSILTILGVALSSGLLFIILTLYFSNFINTRNELRKQADYEMVFITYEQSELSHILEEDYIKNAYSGSYYSEFDNKYVNNALYINVENPYKINTYFEKLTEKYEMEGYINEQLASYYLQGDVGNENYIKLLMFLFLSFIFAIIGVGIIRNTIQLNTIEQIKDYGIMRCIGATNAELKAVIFKMGFIQEIAGIVIGIIIGYSVAVIIGSISHIKVGIHLICFVYILLVFIGDLFFVMSENSKIIKKISPVEAVRGKLSGNVKKLKVRRKNIFGVLMGFYGDYAYKSLMGNKKRFVKTIGALTFGVVALTIISLFYYSYSDLNKSIVEGMGEYPIYFYEVTNGMKDIDNAKSYLPGENELRQIAEISSVEALKAVYIACINAAYPDDIYEHYDEQYISETYEGLYIKSLLNKKDDNQKKLNAAYAGITLLGYDETEYKSYEKLLIDGTLDVSDSGIVLVQNCMAYPLDYDSDLEIDLKGNKYRKSDYQVGETIELLDYAKLQALYERRYDEYIKSDDGFEDEDLILKKKLEIYADCCEELSLAGEYKTYTVEGIVDIDKDNMYSSSMITAIVPLDNYCNMLGVEKGSAATGIKYKLKNYNLDTKTINRIIEISDNAECMTSYDEIINLYSMQTLKKLLGYMFVFVVFVIITSALNIINTSASNIYIRRQELAQLRVVGLSLKGICRIVVMEGVITTIIANVLGVTISVLMISVIKNAFAYVFGLNIVFPIGAMLIGLLYTLAVTCLSIYIPIRRMRNDLLDELK